MTVFNWLAASALDVDGGGGGEVEKLNEDVMLVRCMVMSIVVGATSKAWKVTLFHGFLNSTLRICRMPWQPHEFILLSETSGRREGVVEQAVR